MRNSLFQSTKLFTFILLLCLHLTMGVFGQTSSSLDPTFFPGRVNTGISQYYDEGHAVAIQPDGKIVMAGHSIISSYDFSLVRYNSDGTLDTSFDGDGKVTTDFNFGGVNNDFVLSVAIQPDGKIVAAGRCDSFSSIAVARYLSNGSLDTSFDGDGRVITIINNISSAFDVQIQSDGKIVIGGSGAIFGSGVSRFVVVRYNTDGSPDTSFDYDGIAESSGINGFANSIAIQTDGKIIAAGIHNNAGNKDFGLVRFNADGSRDTSFGSNGNVSTPIGSLEDIIQSVALQTDGRILVGGHSDNATSRNFALARYNSDGSLDTSFDGDGKLTTAIGLYDFANSILIQPDNKIVAAGWSGGSLDNDFALVRYNTDGSLDTSFDFDGKAITRINNGTNDIARAVVLQSDGKIVLAGQSHNGEIRTFTLARYNTNGSLDNTFGNRALLGFSPSSGNDQANATVVQSDGKILVVGNSRINTNYDFALARLNTDGLLDTTFDSDGKVATPIGSSDDFALASAIQSDGKIIVAGASYNGGLSSIALVRYNTNGSLDTTFDSDGKVTTAVGDSVVAYSVTIQSDGKIVVAGASFTTANSNDFVVVRYNTDGSLDTTFDTDGIVTTPIGTSSDYAYSVHQQSDGKIVVAGYVSNGADNDFALARYNTDGSLDSSFDGDGKVITTGTSEDLAFSSAIQSDGKIVVAGYTNNTSNDFMLARYNTDGSLDTSFDSDGIVVTPIGNSSDIAFSVAIQSDNKIIAAGNSFNGVNQDFALARYNTNGSLDTGFGSYAYDAYDAKSFLSELALISIGKITIPIGGGDDIARAIAIQSNGKLIVAGYANNGIFDDFAVVRLNTGFAPTAANVNVSGKVFGSNGMAVNQAIVMITDNHGNTRTAVTNPFGYYCFEDVEVGQTYIFKVFSKRHQFALQVITVNEQTDSLNFTADP